MTTRHLLAFASIFAFACGGSVTEGTGGGGGSGGGSTTSTSSSSACECDAYAPVCGADGQTYNAGCGDDCVPVAIACRNECPCVSCDDLRAAYAAALVDARACNPLIDVNECTLEVPDQLDCPCSIYVNPSNTDAMAALDSIQQAFEANGCGPEACPAIACEAPTGGACVGRGSTGVCENQYLNPGG